MNNTKARLPTQVSHAPRVYIADDFMNAAEIGHVLTRYGRTAVGPSAGIPWNHGIAGRSGELLLASDRVLVRLAARIDEVLGFGCALQHATFRYRCYAPGDFHPGHVDCHVIAGQHLVATALLYLTDADEGGATVFPHAPGQPLAIAARRGRLALWFNYTPDGEVDRASYHHAERLERGEKVTLAYFVYAPLACAARAPATLPAMRLGSAA